MKYTQSKRIINAYKVYHHSIMSSIYDAYKCPSLYKIEAFDRCMSLMVSLGGCNMRIIGCNKFSFTCGFMFPNAVDNSPMFMYITQSEEYYCELSYIYDHYDLTK